MVTYVRKGIKIFMPITYINFGIVDASAERKGNGVREEHFPEDSQPCL